MYMFFDTETTGIPRNYRAPVTDLGNWPRVVQVAYLVTDGEGVERGSYQAIIVPEGFVIPADAARVHGITTERALAEGVKLRGALDQFVSQMAGGVTLVAHNMSFDEKVLGAEFLRAQMTNPLPGAKRLCTMEASTNYCALPGPYGYKWPRLEQLHEKLFGEAFADAHSALGDVKACARCFFELRKRGVM